MARPIRPNEIEAAKRLMIPDEVFQVFNDAIVEAWNGHYATLKASEIALKIARKLGISREKVYLLGYMDIEPIYKESGWIVDYDQPAYCENYEATYKFSKKSN